jgi:hypothetical protein
VPAPPAARPLRLLDLPKELRSPAGRSACLDPGVPARHRPGDQLRFQQHRWPRTTPAPESASCPETTRCTGSSPIRPLARERDDPSTAQQSRRNPKVAAFGRDNALALPEQRQVPVLRACTDTRPTGRRSNPEGSPHRRHRRLRRAPRRSLDPTSTGRFALCRNWRPLGRGRFRAGRLTRRSKPAPATSTEALTAGAQPRLAPGPADEFNGRAAYTPRLFFHGYLVLPGNR